MATSLGNDSDTEIKQKRRVGGCDAAEIGGIALDEGINVREWGRTLQMAPEVTARVEAIWQRLDFQEKSGKQAASQRIHWACCY